MGRGSSEREKKTFRSASPFKLVAFDSTFIVLFVDRTTIIIIVGDNPIKGTPHNITSPKSIVSKDRRLVERFIFFVRASVDSGNFFDFSCDEKCPA